MKVFEVTKKSVPAERNPVAAYAQRSGAGVHKDQNKKNKPLRKEKHKKKDFSTETYKQKAGDYARHGGAMPKKKKRGPHPLGGKLVG
jgi:hypothetical protein